MHWKNCCICVRVFSNRVFAISQKQVLPRDGHTQKQTNTEAQSSKGFGHRWKQNGVQHIQTCTHAVFAERAIKILDGRLDDKIDTAGQAVHWFFWLPTLVTYYNTQYEESDTTYMAP